MEYQGREASCQVHRLLADLSPHLTLVARGLSGIPYTGSPADDRILKLLARLHLQYLVSVQCARQPRRQSVV